MDLRSLQESFERIMQDTRDYVSRREQKIEGYIEEIKAEEQQIRQCQIDDDQYHRLTGRMDFKVHQMMIEWREGERQWLRAQQQLDQINEQTNELEKQTSGNTKLVLTTMIPLFFLWVINSLISVAGLDVQGMAYFGINWRTNKENEEKRSQLQRELLKMKQEVQNSAEKWDNYRDKAIEIVQSVRVDNNNLNKDSNL